uniref:AMP-activated protein kinase glycogen-binding domain-containing protein n=1 Tax=Rhodosorus marinus TaxID=101924 RepID=A0A7S2ZVJ8_9RHOD|mmetsp:Transcript_34315/g.134586  ORF Transcript_34315/g.134586 Transcript_34315/m.134586 type:complete len:323 (+) Transcript_34315:239-1207(+)
MEAEVEAAPVVEVVDTTEVKEYEAVAPVEEPPVVQAFEPVDVDAAVAQESSARIEALEQVKDGPIEEVVADTVEVGADPVEVGADPVEVVADPVEVVADPVEVADEVVPAMAEAPAVDNVEGPPAETADVVPEAALEAVAEDEQAMAEVRDVAEGDVAPPPAVDDLAPPADLSEAVEEKDEGMADIIAEGKAASAAGVDAGELDPVTALGDDDTEDVVLVQTEFVWPEGAARDVKLCGDWNNFLPIQMYSEGVSGFWSVVTPVPIGDHEFKFIVDGVWRVSKVHPLAGEGGNEVNFRSVKGIPRSLPSVSFPGLGRPRRYFS